MTEKEIDSVAVGLYEKDREFRRSAASALSKVGAEFPEHLTGTTAESLSDALSDEDDSVRGWAALASKRFGRVTSENIAIIIPSLVDALEDEQARVRSSASDALNEIAEQSPEMLKDEVTKMTEVLCRDSKNEDDISARENVVSTIGTVGSEYPSVADPIVSSLLESLQDSWHTVRKETISAIGDIGGSHPGSVEPAIPQVLDRLSDEDETKNVRIEAIRTVRQIGAERPSLVRDAVPLLDELLPDEIPRGRVSRSEARLEELAYGDSVPIEAWKTVQVLVEEEPDIAEDVTIDMSAQK